jgi:hypothetical protein
MLPYLYYLILESDILADPVRMSVPLEASGRELEFLLK